MARILSGIFFASGASALIFETLWFHQAGLALGNGVWASALVLSGFMAGIGLGNGLAFRFGDRIRNPIAAYALLEVAIAVTGLALVAGLPHMGRAIAPLLAPIHDAPVVLAGLRFGTAFLFLLIPSTAMGLTLPLLTKALTRDERDFGRALGLLYGWNTLGAVAGVVLAEHWLIALLGISGSAWAAAAANLAAAGLAGIVASRRRGSGITEANDTPPSPIPESARPRADLRRWLVAAFTTGFCLLALEVVWFRLLSMHVFGFSESLATMLAVILCGMALGGMLGSALTARLDKAHRFAPLVAIAAGLILILSYNAASALTPHLDTTSLYAGVDVLLLAVPLMLPLALLSGLFYTLAGAAIRESEASDARSAGILTLFNTAGAALGPLVAAFLLLPTIGTEMSVVLIALVYAVIGAFLLARKEGTRLPEIAALLALALSMAWFPFGSLDRALVKTAIDRWATGTTTEVAWLSEGPAETVMYLGRRELGEPHSHRMLTNGFSMSATNVNSRRYMKLYVYLPIAIHPEPRSALLVSYGVGNTAKALTDTRALEHIDVVDISANVLAAASVVYPDPEDHPLKDPRVNVHVEDGRYFMQTTAQRYDLITSEPPPPRAAGVVNLYTREYYRLIRDRLNEGGMVSYWLPIHSLTEAATLSIVRSFCDVFEDCSLWHGDRTDLMLLGSNRARERVTEGHFLAQWQDEVVGPEMKRLGFEQPGQLGALFIGGADYLEKLTADALPLVDDHPKRVMAGFDFAPASTPPFENAWGPAEAARDRFKESELIARLWPESLRKETEDFFETQALLDRLSLRPDVNLERDIESLHHTLTETELATPILWAFGSDADIGRIIETAAKPRLDDPRVILQWGARSLAARRYEEAAQHYEAAARQPDQERFATRMQVFALCMAGELDGARSVAELRYGSVGRPLPLSPFWTWMQTRYHVLPSLLAGDLGPKDTHAALLH